MNLLPDIQQQELMDEAEQHLSRALGGDALKGWAEHGWFGLDLSGEGFINQTLLFRLLGRHLAEGPFLAATLGAGLAAECGDDRLSQAIAAREVSIGLAYSDDPEDGNVSATVQGVFRSFDGQGAAYSLVVSPNAAALVELAAVGQSAAVLCLDPATSMESLAIDGKARCLGDGLWWMRGAALAAAMLAGIAEATRDHSAQHARTRHQFGRPIGAFQAIKHRCSDMAIQAEAAWCQVAYASLTLAAQLPDAFAQVHAAKVVAGAAAIENAGANIQNHGALGCTTLDVAHLYLKRSWVLEHVCGSSEYHRRGLMEHVEAF
jgi:hypothetical protein